MVSWDWVWVIVIVSVFVGIYMGNPRFRASFNEAIRSMFDKDAGE